MELHLPYFQNLFIFIIFLCLIVKLVHRNSNRKLPPGPWRLPLIGNMHQLVGSPPHHVLRDLAKKHGPLLFLQLGETSNIVISSPEIAREVLITNGVKFAQRPCIYGIHIMSYNSRCIAFSPYGSYWKQLRKICTVELFSAKQVQSFRSIREEEVSALVKFIASKEGSTFNLTKKIYALTFDIISRAAFGSKCKDQDAYLSCLQEFFELTAGFNLVDVYPSIKILQVITGMKQKLKKLFRKSDSVIQGILDEHKQQLLVEKKDGVLQTEQEDLVTTLLKLQENGDLEFPLTDINIKAVIWNVFSAGTETSSTAVDWAMAEMIKNPRILEKAQREVRTIYDGKGDVDETCLQEMKYLKAVIKESLRLHPPGPLSVPRQSTEKCEINGFEIPAKTRVLVNVWAMGRDPDYWSEAERFLPERFLDSTTDFLGSNLEFIPFGAGRRICPGISFALADIELPLAQLLYHFDWKLPNEMKDLDMTEAFGLTLTRKDDLILFPTIYQHSVYK